MGRLSSLSYSQKFRGVLRGLGLASAAMVTLACAVPKESAADPTVREVRPRHELSLDPMPFGAIPWPDPREDIVALAAFRVQVAQRQFSPL